ncbi:MAG: hypothetical protein ABT14_18575 [Pelagibacterium sp. SCN 63-17]|nr:MAG: hypothetical protein ABT14_18575 [Pelagibacterium sp. SCN 63-17]
MLSPYEVSHFAHRFALQNARGLANCKGLLERFTFWLMRLHRPLPLQGRVGSFSDMLMDPRPHSLPSRGREAKELRVHLSLK